MARKTPQEKKALSYAKDRRNVYGENAKSSRKNIPWRKRLVNRANRHQDDQNLSAAVGRVAAEVAEAAQQRAAGRRPKTWRKRPDVPLADKLAKRHSGAKGPKA